MRITWAVMLFCQSLLWVPCRALAEDQPALEAAGQSVEWTRILKRSPWVFLGDSNTYSGGYVAVLDAWLDVLPQRPKLLNLGVASETASGLSEADHPFKRPCVHERLAKVLAVTQPEVVFVCYGMNDGIYQPASQENMQAYREGMLRLAERIQQTGAELICLTPPLFEPGPVHRRGQLGPSEQGRYAYFAPAADYDRVLEEQATWCLQNEFQALKVVDIHSMLHAEKQKRLIDDPDFAFSKDGVHFGMEAHALIAERILVELGAPEELLKSYPTNDQVQAAVSRGQILRNAYLSATGKNRPGLPAGLPVWLAERKAAKYSLSPQSR